MTLTFPVALDSKLSYFTGAGPGGPNNIYFSGGLFNSYGVGYAVNILDSQNNSLASTFIALGGASNATSLVVNTTVGATIQLKGKLTVTLEARAEPDLYTATETYGDVDALHTATIALQAPSNVIFTAASGTDYRNIGSTATAPEPGSIALLGTLAIPMVATLRLRRRKGIPHLPRRRSLH